MPEKGDTLRLLLSRDQDGLLCLGAWVDAVIAELHLTGRTAFGLRLCLEEAVANLVMHGIPSPGIASDTIGIEVSSDDDSIHLTIEDHCQPFDPTRAETPNGGGVGGQGLVLMRQFASTLRYYRAGAANRLHLTLSRM